MFHYLMANIEEAQKPLETLGWKLPILIGLVDMVVSRFAGLGSSLLFFTMCFVWFANFVLGTGLAISNSYHGREEKWTYQKAAGGIMRLVAFVFAFGVMHLAAQAGLSYATCLVDIVLIVCELARFITNWGIVTGNEKLATAFVQVTNNVTDKAMATLNDLSHTGDYRNGSVTVSTTITKPIDVDKHGDT